LPFSNNVGMKKVGEMDLGSATNHFFALEADPSQPMLELTHNHDRTEPYDKGDGYAHVAFTVDGLEETVERLKSQGVNVTLEPKTLTADGERLQNRLRRGPRRIKGGAGRARHPEGRGDVPVRFQAAGIRLQD
jgi:catechol 2,3-dioxygenase-like lactoylglutathione lyase family enzyme